MPMMIKKMTSLGIASLAAVGLAFMLGACSTTPEGEKPPASDAAPAPKPQALPAERKTPPTVDLTARGNQNAALKDPNNILSKRSILFDYDKYEIKDEYKGMVEAHAKYLRDNAGAKMLIQGNADERGS